jgi:hypothetical protein
VGNSGLSGWFSTAAGGWRGAWFCGVRNASETPLMRGFALLTG